MTWKNGRKISDKEEFEKVKAAYFEPRVLSTEFSNAELMDNQMQRERLSTNQAR